MKVFLLIASIVTLGFIACQDQVKGDSKSSVAIMATVDMNKVKLVQLARPNSEIPSSKELELRKNELCNMQLSTKYLEWDNPTSGAILHITKADKIEVHQFILEFNSAWQSTDNEYVELTPQEDEIELYPFTLEIESMNIDETTDERLTTNIVEKKQAILINKKDIKQYISALHYGDITSILITSECDLKHSKSIDFILEEWYDSATQIYYLQKR